MTSPRYLARLATLALAALLAVPCYPQKVPVPIYPNKLVRIIVGGGMGGGTDLVARLVAGKMSEGLGQPVIVENKPDQHQIIAAEYVAKAPPDGYTLLMGANGGILVNPAIFSKLPYSPLRDFAPVSVIGTFPLLIMVNPSLPVKSLEELVEYAKARPKQVFYASASTSFRLAGELFKQKTGTEFVHVPYKSSAEELGAIVTNQVTMAIVDLPPMTGPLKSGQIRGLAVLAAERHQSFPDIPSAADLGLPELGVPIFQGLFAPIATPPSVVKRLQEEVARVVRLPDIRERLLSMSINPSGNTSEEFGRMVASGIAKWTAVAKTANIKAD